MKDLSQLSSNHATSSMNILVQTTDILGIGFSMSKMVENVFGMKILKQRFFFGLKHEPLLDKCLPPPLLWKIS